MTYPVLALDLGTKTGWAFGAPGETPEYGLHDLSSYSPAQVFSQFDFFLSDMIATLQPALIAVEDLAVYQRDSTQSKLMSFGLRAVTELVAFRRDIALKPVHRMTAAKALTGSGKAKDIKQRCMDACLAMGWKPQDDNVADALAVWVHATTVIVPTIEEVA